jgi:hypothetical protein
MLDGYLPKAGLLTNIQQMTLPITRDKMEPDFREVASLDSREETVEVECGKSGTILRFPHSMSKENMAAAIKAEPRFQKEEDLPKFMRFYGWTVAQHGHGVRIPFKYITSSGLLLALAGSILLVSRPTKTRHERRISS